MLLSTSRLLPDKTGFRQGLLKSAGISRIHIVGCARSGTTMLHYAMAAFEDTILYDKEISPWTYPQTIECLGLAGKYFLKKGNHKLVSKRNVSWWKKEHLEKLIEFKQRYDLILIHIVRDPRDVLTSRHKLSKNKFYLTPEKWHDSISGGLMLDETFETDPHYLTLKYEDVVCTPQKVLQTFNQKFGLTLNPMVEDWSHLASNLSRLKVKGKMEAYMHKLRDFDPSTIRKWKNDISKKEYLARLMQSEYGNYIENFLNRYNYPA